MKSLTAAVILAGSLVASACVGASGRVYVRSGPPPLRAEVVSRSPGAGLVWVPGYCRGSAALTSRSGGRYERPRVEAPDGCRSVGNAIVAAGFSSKDAGDNLANPNRYITKSPNRQIDRSSMGLSQCRRERISSNLSKDDLIDMQGTVVAVHSGGLYRVQCDAGHEVLAQLSGRMRRFRIKVVPGDRVTVGVSPYDPVRGIITFRAR